MNQPLPAPAANPSLPNDRHGTRLLRAWYDLTVRAAVAEAHGGADANDLRDHQCAIEQALIEHDPRYRHWLDERLAWEASLIHVADLADASDLSPQACFVCRRARQQIPAHLRGPALVGSLR